MSFDRPGVNIKGSYPVQNVKPFIYISNVDKSDPNNIYIGLAMPNSKDSDAAWFIIKYEYSSGQEKIRFANGNNEFNKIWDNRNIYNYL